MLLDKIIKVKKEEVRISKEKLPEKELENKLKKLKIKNRSFIAAIKQKKDIALIAEIKFASPTLGIIRKNITPVRIAKIYERAGADCLSILTDKQFFYGDIEFIKKVRKNVSLPTLRKDFIIDRYQLFESKLYHADCVLLIAAILNKPKLKELIELAKELQLEYLIEVHTKAELNKVLDLNYDMIAINNRNLRNFQVNLNTTERLIKYIPSDKIVISESGIKNREDIKLLRNLGIDAVLIGEALMKAKDITQKINELFR